MDDCQPSPDAQPQGHAPRRLPTGRLLGIAMVLALLVTGATRFTSLQASPCGSPDNAGISALSSAADLVVLDSGDTRIVGTTAVATLDGGGLFGAGSLTLPRADGGTTRIPDVSELVPLGLSDELVGRAVLTCSGGSRAVVDLVTGAVLFEIPAATDAADDLPGGGILAPFDLARTGDGPSGWTVTDLRTGQSRQLAETVVAAAGEKMVPIDASHYPGDTWVVRYGSSDAMKAGGVPAHAGAFAIVGSVDRMVPLPGYSRFADAPGLHRLAVSGDGRMVAWEIEEGDDRLVVADSATGDEIVRYGVDDVGETLAIGGFAADGRLVITSGQRVLTLAIESSEGVTELAAAPGTLGNPLVYPPDNIAYVRQAERILSVDLDDGEMAEVWSGRAPQLLDFTRVGAAWITFRTDTEQVLLDARTGQVVSRITTPVDDMSQLDRFGAGYDTLGSVSASGDTIIGYARGLQSDRVWILSPRDPGGLVLRVGGLRSDFTISADGATIYAVGHEETFGGPSRALVAPVAPDASWTVLAEDADDLVYVPLVVRAR